jgi:formate/nitrite transporter FocA (FNT family)
MFRPLTVQTDGVFEINVTVKVELAVALDANGVTDIVFAPGLLKVIVCAVEVLTGNT